MRKKKLNYNSISNISNQTHLVEGTSSLRFWFVLIIIALVYIVFRANLINIPLDRDEGLFGYIGQVLLDGGVPYRDAVDHKPPLVYFMYAVGLLFVPPTAAGVHLFLHVYNALTLVVLFYAIRSYAGTMAGLGTAFAYAVFSSAPSIQGFTASTEMFMLLPVSLSLLFAIRGVQTKKNILFALSGACGALACWTKQSAVFVAFFMFIYCVLAPAGGLFSWKNFALHGLRRAAWWLSGGAFVSAVVIAYFWRYGILSEMIYWSFTHNALYSNVMGNPEMLSSIGYNLLSMCSANFFTIAIGCVAAFINMLLKNPHGLFAAGFLVCSLMSVLPGSGYNHYFAQAAPAVAVATGLGFAAIICALGPRRETATMLLCAFAIAGLPLISSPRYYFTQRGPENIKEYFSMSPFPETEILAGFIAPRTEKNDTIFVLGTEPQVYFLSDRRCAGAFPLVYPMTRTVYPRHMEFQEHSWESIQRLRPKYIIFADRPDSVLWDGKTALWLWKKLARFCAEEYELEAFITVESPCGRLFMVKDVPNLKEQLKHTTLPLLIHKRRQ